MGWPVGMSRQFPSGISGQPSGKAGNKSQVTDRHTIASGLDHRPDWRRARLPASAACSGTMRESNQSDSFGYRRACMNSSARESGIGSTSSATERSGFVLGLWGVRYQVKDISRSIDFYTRQLGFKLDRKHPPAFAQVSAGNLKLILSGPGA